MPRNLKDNAERAEPTNNKSKRMSNVIFVSGIDTDAGKTYATGWYARQLMNEGHNVATQKFIQTGNTGMSEDIEAHRRIMGIDLMEVDTDHLTAPVIFSYPASAQLAATIDRKTIDLKVIDEATRMLADKFDTVLIEGAGGLMAPIDDDFLTIDYIKTRNLPVSLVTNSKLGSISHTLLCLDAIKTRGIRLHSVMYNAHFDSADKLIANDTYGFISRYLRRNFPDTPLLTVPSIG